MRFKPSNLSGVLSEVFSSQRSPDEPINIRHFFGARGAGHNRQCEVRMVCWVLGCPGDNSDGTTRDSSSLQLAATAKVYLRSVNPPRDKNIPCLPLAILDQS